MPLTQGQLDGNAAETRAQFTRLMAAITPLEGFTIGVTANLRSKVQLDAWTAAGAYVEHAPLLGIIEFDHVTEVIPSLDHILNVQPELMIFTSAAGVRSVVAAATNSGLLPRLATLLDEVTVFATGVEVAAELTSVGYGVDSIIGSGTTADVLAEVERLVRPNGMVSVQVDGGSDEVATAVEQSGRVVSRISAYRWGPSETPDEALSLVKHSASGRLDALTFTVAGAVDEFIRIAETAGLAQQVKEAPILIICLDRSCADIAIGHGFREVVCPPRPGIASMIRVAELAFASRGTVIELPGHQLNLRGRLVQLDNQPVPLSDRELDVLIRLARRPGAVVSKAELVRSVWGGNANDTHVVEVSVGRLRQRLGVAGAHIETVIRRGYRLNVE